MKTPANTPFVKSVDSLKALSNENSSGGLLATNSPPIFKALQAAQSGLADLRAKNLFRRQRQSESACDTHQTFNTRTFNTFCSNDYLGLANHPMVVQAARDALSVQGVGSGASHLISGHHQAHEALGQRLAAMQAAHIPQVKSLTFSSGYMANLGVITALCALPKAMGQEREGAEDGTRIYSAQLNHASIVDGIRLASKQSSVQLCVFDSTDLNTLRGQLEEDASHHKLIVCDGVFSMDGNLGPVKELLELATQHDALLLIDDAHGFGVLGEDGHGILEHFQLHSDRLIYIGTLGKAAGVFGAFVCAHETLCDWIFQKARSYIYTTASPPSLAMATLQSLNIIESAEGHARRAHLKLLIQTWRETLKFKHWQTPPSHTPIQPVVVGDNALCLQLDAALQSMGFLIPAIRPPTVPLGTARLRVTFSANHTLQEVQTLAEVLMDLENQHSKP